MDQMILDIAWAVRHACEKNLHLLGCYYSAELGGLCGVASSAIVRIAQSPDVEFVAGRFGSSYCNCGECFEGVNHSWVLAKDQVLDVTATQFEIKDKVYLPTPDKAKSTYHQVKTGLAAKRMMGLDRRDVDLVTRRALRILKEEKGRTGC